MTLLNYLSYIKWQLVATKSIDELNVGRLKEYAQFLTEAKRTNNTFKQVKKLEPLILQGRGLNDRYRK
ncbi:hypothetical protein [Christiangramia portivictoriae]|uniref:hypothetical protein n=1 Tax=Christiangramia portivictoriae TaxID=326069 RepID=UPI000406CD38|nr:hypothetical protein [Christiangramia portivictoriae]